MTLLTQETPAPRHTDIPLLVAPLAHPPIRNPLARLRRVVPQTLHPLSWIAAERVASAQASLFRRQARQIGLDPVDLVRALPNIRVRQDNELPCTSTHYWDPISRRWIVAVKDSLSETNQRFLILREFKYIIDCPDSLRLYDADHERGRVQAEMAGDHFALCALMPAAEVRDAIRNGIVTLSELAAHFTTSTYRVSLRLSDLGLTSKAQTESKGGDPS